MSGSIQEIRDYLLDTSNDPLDAQELEGSRSLLETGVLDSLRLIELLGFLNSRFSIQIGPDEIVPENFRTLETIAAFVDGKVDGKTGATE